MPLYDPILRCWASCRNRSVDHFRRHPHEVQRRTLETLLATGRKTRFGQAHQLESVHTAEAFRRRVERTDYEGFKPWIDRMLQGERDVTAPGRVTLYAKSSGTTSDRSKYIPVTRTSVWRNHTQGMRDVAALYLYTHPAGRVFSGKMLTLGGSCSREGANLVGDLSAVLIQQTALWSGWFRTPSAAIATLPNFDDKVAAICRRCASEHITAFAGVPSWNLALMRAMLAYTGKSNLLEVWPDLEVFAHGGVEFAPYRESFAALIPTDRMQYIETYNASEGFFALADDPARDDMLLMLDYDTYYEFRHGDEVVPLEGVRAGETYAIIITSCNGLWRYEIGDTVTFTSTDPYRIRFAGRTRQYINVFGEELIAENAERALLTACRKTGASVAEYSVAPCFMSLNRQGAHEWVIEFEREAEDLEAFADALDHALRAVNSDYDAKRATTLERQHLVVLQPGTLLKWLQRRRKNKVPRLVNDRRAIDDILAFAAAEGAIQARSGAPTAETDNRKA